MFSFFCTKEQIHIPVFFYYSYNLMFIILSIILTIYGCLQLFSRISQRDEGFIVERGEIVKIKGPAFFN